MNKIAIILSGMALGLSSLCHAQSLDLSDMQGDFDDFVNSITTDFDNFRSQIIADYIEFLRNPWKEFDGKSPIPNPDPVPPVPPVVIPEDDKIPVVPDPVVIEEPVDPIDTTPVIVPEPQPEPVIPINPEPVIDTRRVDFMLYGTPMSVRVAPELGQTTLLPNLKEGTIADGFKTLSDPANDITIADCLRLRKEYNLSDWAYLQMLYQLAYDIMPSKNDANLLAAYLFIQSGYMSRLANNGKSLYLLFATPHTIYEWPYYTFGDYNYYSLEPMPMKVSVCQAAFPQEKPLSLLITKNQKFALDKAETVTRTSKRYPFFTTTSFANKNMMDFYTDYPSSQIGDNMMSRWAAYANTPMDECIVEQIYPTIRQKLEGKTKLEALNILLNYVQTGFEYEYDDKIWGKDRAFFAEESLNYPYCDCEDRSILMTRLVRDILDTNCLLVYYPGHMACAIEMPNTEATGDYLTVGGKHYIIADPTYVNATLGCTMPGMDNSTAKVILLDK